MKNLTILLFLILLVGCKSECTEAAVETALPAEVQETLIEEVVPEILEPEVKPTEEVPVKELTDEEIEKIF